MFPALPAQLPSLLAHVSVSPSFDAHVFIYENTQTHKQMMTTIPRSSLQKPVFPACFPSKQEKEEPVQCSLQAVRATFVFFFKNWRPSHASHANAKERKKEQPGKRRESECATDRPTEESA